jgi:hypothetical protein
VCEDVRTRALCVLLFAENALSRPTIGQLSVPSPSEREINSRARAVVCCVLCAVCVTGEQEMMKKKARSAEDDQFFNPDKVRSVKKKETLSS